MTCSTLIKVNFHQGVLTPVNVSGESVRDCVHNILYDHFQGLYMEGDILEIFAEELSDEYLIIDDTVYRINEAILSSRHTEATKQKDGSFSYLIAIPANGYTNKSDALYRAVSDAK